MSTFTDQQQVLSDAIDILGLRPVVPLRKVQIGWLSDVRTDHKRAGKCRYSSSGECEAVQFARKVLTEISE